MPVGRGGTRTADEHRYGVEDSPCGLRRARRPHDPLPDPFGRLTAAGTVIAAAVGTLIGPVNLDAFPLSTRMFHGALGGLVIGALVGVLASTLACTAAAVLRAAGQRLSVQRFTFTVVGTLAALAFSPWSLSPLDTRTGLPMTVALGLVTATAGTALARRFLVGLETGG